MTINNDKQANPEYLDELEKAQNERIEQMFEELKHCKIDFLSEITSRRR